MGEKHEALRGQIEVAHYLHWLGGQTSARRRCEAGSVLRRAKDRAEEIVRDARNEAAYLTTQAQWLDECTPAEVAAYMGIDVGGETCPMCAGSGRAEGDTCDRCLGVGKIDPFLG